MGAESTGQGKDVRKNSVRGYNIKFFIEYLVD